GELVAGLDGVAGGPLGREGPAAAAGQQKTPAAGVRTRALRLGEVGSLGGGNIGCFEALAGRGAATARHRALQSNRVSIQRRPAAGALPPATRPAVCTHGCSYALRCKGAIHGIRST